MLNSLLTQNAPVIAAAAIDIDGTVLVQMVMFLTVIIVMHFLLYRPYLKAIEARKEGVQGSREDAAEMEARASTLISEYEEKMRQARRDAQDVRESLRSQGLKEQDDIIEEVRGEIAAKLEGERQTIASSVESATRELKQRADNLAGAMVDKVVPAA